MYPGGILGGIASNRLVLWTVSPRKDTGRVRAVRNLRGKCGELVAVSAPPCWYDRCCGVLIRGRETACPSLLSARILSVSSMRRMISSLAAALLVVLLAPS